MGYRDQDALLASFDFLVAVRKNNERSRKVMEVDNASSYVFDKDFVRELLAFFAAGASNEHMTSGHKRILWR